MYRLMSSHVHKFLATAFAEKLSIRELAGIFPEAQTLTQELRLPLQKLRMPLADSSEAFLFPFAAVVFRDVPKELRELQMARLRRARPGLSTDMVLEDFTVCEEAGATASVAPGVLTVDRLTPGRAGIVAMTVGQSAAMEYYERIVDRLFVRLQDIAAQMKVHGTVPLRTRSLHRFIAEAITTRSEVLSVLHLLDKPEEAWDDPAMDSIYSDLRAEFDLEGRYGTLESKLHAIQDGLTLILEIARDRRLVLLESAVVFLIILEVVLGFLRA
jgi:uncharacterized Rmd1/YagE family protein